MKSIRFSLLALLLTTSLGSMNAQAQYSRAKELAREVAPRPASAPTRPPARPAPAPATVPATPAQARPNTSTAAKPAASVDTAKSVTAKDQATRKTIEFQKRRAEEGSATAQYDLGMRYLKGDGVEQNEAKGRELLEASAKNGFNPAAKKLEELAKLEPKKK
jgi:TPR repeat protein